MSILITGGAGYIGSVTTELLRARGEEVVVLDNLSRGYRDAVIREIPFYEGDVGNRELVRRIVRNHGIDACIHFAAFAYVGESVKQPALYYENNVAQGIHLLGALIETGVRQFVFSSTCATYGEPQRIPISEEHPRTSLPTPRKHARCLAGNHNTRSSRPSSAQHGKSKSNGEPHEKIHSYCIVPRLPGDLRRILYDEFWSNNEYQQRGGQFATGVRHQQHV